MVDDRSYLLLIRDEGGPPELQFCSWVDAVILVFSVEDEMSFQMLYNFYAKIAHYRNTADLPMILVGTQGKDSQQFKLIMLLTKMKHLRSSNHNLLSYMTLNSRSELWGPDIWSCTIVPGFVLHRYRVRVFLTLFVEFSHNLYNL